MRLLADRQRIGSHGRHFAGAGIGRDGEPREVIAIIGREHDVSQTGALVILAVTVIAKVENALVDGPSIPGDPGLDGKVRKTGDQTVRQIYVAASAGKIEFAVAGESDAADKSAIRRTDRICRDGGSGGFIETITMD